MTPTNPITVRLEVEGMRHQIIHAFAAHSVEITDLVAAEVTREIEAFDFGLEVRRCVHKELPIMIQAAIESALRRAVYSDDVRKILDDAVMAGARKVVADAP